MNAEAVDIMANLFAGSRQITMSHFYLLGTPYPGSNQLPKVFSYAYWTHDGSYVTGLAHWDNEQEKFYQPSDQQIVMSFR